MVSSRQKTPSGLNRVAKTDGEKIHLADRLALTVGEAAAAVGVSERHFRSMLTEIPHTYIGSRVVIPVDELREWLRNQVRRDRNRVDEVVEKTVRALTRD